MLHLPGLALRVADRLPEAVTRVLARDLSGPVRSFGRWGRYLRPVDLCVAADQVSLRGAAELPTVLDLRGLCRGDSVWLLDPAAWPDPPSDRELADLLLHELAHALWNQNTAPAAGGVVATPPTWFREGFAVVVAEGPPAPAIRRQLDSQVVADAAYADDAQLVALGPVAYTAAAVAFDAWTAQFGRRSLGALQRGLRRGLTFARAFETACGTGDRAYIAQLTTTMQR